MFLAPQVPLHFTVSVDPEMKKQDLTIKIANLGLGPKMSDAVPRLKSKKTKRVTVGEMISFV